MGRVPIVGISVPHDQRITLAWSDIVVRARPPPSLWDRVRKCRRTKETVTILNNVSGVAESGTLTALMGCSAGKTTLMNVLAQRNLADLDVDGSVLLNGTQVNNAKSFHQIVGYIQQHDVLPETLTVREYLSFVVTLLYHRTLTNGERIHKVNQVIFRLSLRKCQNVLIGGEKTNERISGGERKRVSIAAQILNNPRVLLLDEPTTGLDSYLANVLLIQLRNLAALGYTILCTTHQPSSDVFILFDRLVLLAGGRSAYVGPREEAAEYFRELGFPCPDNFTPASYLIKILTCIPDQENAKQLVTSLCDSYEKSFYARQVDETIDRQYLLYLAKSGERAFSKPYGASLLIQFFLLFQREIISFARFPQRLLGQTLTILVLTFILDSVFWSSKKPTDQGFVHKLSGFLFIYVSCYGLLTSMPVVENLCDHLTLMMKEHRDGLYHALFYYVAILVSEFVFATYILGLHFMLSYYFCAHQTDAQQMFLVWCVLQMDLMVGMGICLLCGTIFEQKSLAIEIIIPVSNIFTVLGGYFINVRGAPDYLKPLFYINWIPWAYEVCTILQWRDGENDIGCEFANNSICVTNGDQVIEKYGFNEDNIGRNLVILAGQIVFYHGTALLIFLFKIRNK